MLDANDMDLVREYASRNSEQAFETLVHRHINLVHSVALRHVRNPAHAEEVTQAVFIILARKAASLRPGTVLGGWLYETARLSSGSFLRSEYRRQRREQEAHMQSLVHEFANDSTWEQLAPHLDEAMATLGEKDRNAVVLRFFQNKSTREIAGSLGVEESAAQKRVGRAVEKLRAFFSKRGVTLSATAVGGMIAANSVHAAPAGLAATVCATAIKGSAVATSTLTLVKGTIKIMAWAKAKTALVTGVAVILATFMTTVIVKRTGGVSEVPTAQEIASQTQSAYAALSSYSDTGKNVATVAGQTITTTFNAKLQRPNLYRIDWTQATGFYTSKGIVWSDGTGDFWVASAAGQERTAKPEKVKDMQTALFSATAASSSTLSTIPALFFSQNWGSVLRSAGQTLKRQRDESVNGVGCYVLSSSMDTGAAGKTSTTLWIGKQDHFIHQTRMTVEKISMATTPQVSDAEIKKVLEMQNRPATPEAIAAFRPILDKTMKLTQDKMNSGKFVYTQTHENISLNEQSSPSDFVR
jgi:RNA polymerase sigma factor (sigma-70 family)